ncbi:HEPN domain-containing protein [Desulfosporosinus hippei]|uniref:HEPN domain-containing protein n=1 Tax=Desulfosporosinus hippei DSM 8344 TaxID=1121419 RepID=A0A1G7VGB1_9FIRM|nr:HEPN domain-containing protein [Desulfosporosinus hippei]SDG58429.1 HEPN domain-containing protein [Desulfosporosinus hippei DSM 8344]
MDRIETKDLPFYRLQSAKERLAVAEDLFKLEHYRDCLSKAYYTLFQAARAALATLELDSRKHSGIISAFNINFVKTGIFPKEYERLSQALRT